MSDDHPNVYTPETLADRWQCSASHVRQMIARGDLPTLRLGGKLLRITADAVRVYEAGASVQPPKLGD
jgi:excisionase family DNA binding protein